MATELTHLKLEGLKLLSRGKVRDVYETSDPEALLFVATDRISAYDVILNNVSSRLKLNILSLLIDDVGDTRKRSSFNTDVAVLV